MTLPDVQTGLYIHIPFCEKKCPYCSFNTYAGFQSLFQDTVDALCLELAQWAVPLQERTIRSIFLGGGTPTILEVEQFAQLFGALHRYFYLDPNCEITCEVNPGTIDRNKFVQLHQLGVNRLSMGVQSFQPDELEFLGRIHNVDDVYRAYEAARLAGFSNVNLDFIFGLPGQPFDRWLNTLEQFLALAPEHLSLYSLIVEPNTPLHHWVRTGQVASPDDDQAAILYETAIEQLASAGYHHYEISNWARAEGEDNLAFTCQHNLIYWRNHEYIGVGPGAHSHLRSRTSDGYVIGKRWGNRKSVPGYIKRVNNQESIQEFSEDIDPPTAMGETMMLGLRLVQEGVSFKRFRQIHQTELEQVFADQLMRLERWGLLKTDDQRVQLTSHGIMIGDQVVAHFLPDQK